MTTSYGFITLKSGKSGMVHLLSPVSFKGGLIHYHIGWADSQQVERLTDKDIHSFTYCSK
jgi:hypothetical protein